MGGTNLAYLQDGESLIYLPLIMKMAVASSHYMNISKLGFDPYSLGQTDAPIHQLLLQSGERLIFVLAWGQPCKFSAIEWGAYSYDGACHAISQLQDHIEDYLIGYCTRMQNIRPGDPGENCGDRYNPLAVPLIIGLGVDNCIGGPGCSNPPGSPSNAVTYEHGQAWGAMVQSVTNFVANNGYAYQIFIVGAMDIEASWNTYTNTKAWLNGYKDASSRNFYNYGTCDCPDGYQPFAPFHRDWSYDRIHEISARGLPVKYPLPEIYRTDGIDARRWQGLSKWAVINGYSKLTFQELLTEYGACSQTFNCEGDQINNPPGNAISQMLQALNADPQTAGGLVSYVRSTDINWYPSPPGP